jgi:hypothetical protein
MHLMCDFFFLLAYNGHDQSMFLEHSYADEDRFSPLRCTVSIGE